MVGFALWGLVGIIFFKKKYNLSTWNSMFFGISIPLLVNSSFGLLGLSIGYLTTPSMIQPSNVILYLLLYVIGVGIVLSFRGLRKNGLFETYVAGVTYEDRQYLVKQLDLSSTLKLVHDPENPYDSNAIRVLSGDKTIGYIPAKLAEDLSFKFEKNDSIAAKIIRFTNVNTDHQGLRIRFQINQKINPYEELTQRTGLRSKTIWISLLTSVCLIVANFVVHPGLTGSFSEVLFSIILSIIVIAGLSWMFFTLFPRASSGIAFLVISLGIVFMLFLYKSDKDPFSLFSSLPAYSSIATATPENTVVPYYDKYGQSGNLTPAFNSTHSNANCSRWDTISVNDVGKTKCVYGNVRNSLYNESLQGYFITFSSDPQSIYFVVYGNWTYGNLDDTCIQLTGEIFRVYNTPVMYIPEGQPLLFCK
ncbi:MAG: HIRAN domain-containing protein [Smithella sp.]